MLATPLYQENKEQILPKIWQIHLFWVPNLKNVTLTLSDQVTFTPVGAQGGGLLGTQV